MVGGDGKPRWSKKRLLSITIPSELESLRQQIIQDFERAFTERGASQEYLGVHLIFQHIPSSWKNKQPMMDLDIVFGK